MNKFMSVITIITVLPTLSPGLNEPALRGIQLSISLCVGSLKYAKSIDTVASWENVCIWHYL